MGFNLIEDGDYFEKIGYNLFIKQKFPSYESFWKKFVVSLTNRPNNINTKSDKDIAILFPGENIEKIQERVAIIQLHYSVFRMMLKAYFLLSTTDKDINSIENCFSHLYSALDISAELFARYDRLKNGTIIQNSPFNQEIAMIDSIKLRRDWEKLNPYTGDIKNIREYRNQMIHGRTIGHIVTPAGKFIILPRLGKQDDYLDWRYLFDSYEKGKTQDLIYGKYLSEDSFNKVIDFIEMGWLKNLLI